MNDLIPINTTAKALVTTELDEEMLDWYIANMPPKPSGHTKTPSLKLTLG